MEWIIITGVIVIGIFVFTVFRSGSNGRRMDDDIDRARKISTGLGTIGDSQDRVEEELDKLEKNNSDAQGRADDIGQHNKYAKTGILSAIDILKRAKDRSNNSGS